MTGVHLRTFCPAPGHRHPQVLEPSSARHDVGVPPPDEDVGDVGAGAAEQDEDEEVRLDHDLQGGLAHALGLPRPASI